MKKMRTKKPPQPEPSALHSVYSGQALRGHILNRGHTFEAYDAEGKPLGMFATERDAADAISSQGSAEAT
jgi:hypothetical protein